MNKGLDLDLSAWEPILARQDEIRAVIRSRLNKWLFHREASEREDLESQVLIELHRAARRERVESLLGLAATIADRRAKSYVRRTVRWEVLSTTDHTGETMDLSDDRPSLMDHHADLERTRQLLGLALQESVFGKECSDIARRRVDWDSPDWKDRPWDDLAADLGISAPALRKRWSRCMAKLKDAIRKDGRFRPLLGWAHAE